MAIQKTFDDSVNIFKLYENEERRYHKMIRKLNTTTILQHPPQKELALQAIRQSETVFQMEKS